MSVILPIRVISEANARSGWRKKSKRVKEQRGVTALCLSNVRAPELPLVVTLTRIAPRRLDDDNLTSSFKAIRDEIAAWLGVDDRDERVRWQCRQASGKPNEYAVRVSFMHPAAELADYEGSKANG